MDRLDQGAAPNAEASKLRGSIYMQQKKWTDADGAFTKALAASPDDAQLHLWMGHTKMELHDYCRRRNRIAAFAATGSGESGSLGRARRASITCPGSTTPRSPLSISLRNAKLLRPINWFFRALSCDKLGRKPEAAAAYQKFLELDRGERPDQEFQAQARLKLLLRELSRSSGK